jgi:hypothetical protein
LKYWDTDAGATLAFLAKTFTPTGDWFKSFLFRQPFRDAHGNVSQILNESSKNRPFTARPPSFGASPRLGT